MPGSHRGRAASDLRRRHRHPHPGPRIGAPGPAGYRHLLHPYPSRSHLRAHLFRPAFRTAQFGADVGRPPRGALHPEEGRGPPDAGAALSGVARGLPGDRRVQGIRERPDPFLRRSREYAHGAPQPSQRRHRVPHPAWRQVDLLHHRHRTSRGGTRQDNHRPVPRRRRDDLRLELYRQRIPALSRLGPFDLAGGRAAGGRCGSRHAGHLPS